MSVFFPMSFVHKDNKANWEDISFWEKKRRVWYREDKKPIIPGGI